MNHFNRLFAKYVVVSIAVSSVAFLVWLLIVDRVPGILVDLGVSADYWDRLEALSTALATATVIGAVVIVYMDRSEAAKTRYIEVADKLFQELNSPTNVAARRWIFENLTEPPETFVKIMSDEDQNKIKQVLNSLDRVSFLTQAGWIPDDVIMPWMHPMIYKSWLKLEPYVQYERGRRNEPYYYRYAEQVSQRCIEWRERNLRPEDRQVQWIDDAL